jgi:hypothetical protein
MSYLSKRYWLAALLLCLGSGAWAAPIKTLVEQHTRAYNQHNVEAYAEYFHRDIEVYNYPDHPITAGRGALIETSQKTFTDRKPQAVIENIMVVGDKAVTLEQVSFAVNGARQQTRVIKIYQFQNGLIRRMTFMY